MKDKHMKSLFAKFNKSIATEIKGIFVFIASVMILLGGSYYFILKSLDDRLNRFEHNFTVRIDKLNGNIDNSFDKSDKNIGNSFDKSDKNIGNSLTRKEISTTTEANKLNDKITSLIEKAKNNQLDKKQVDKFKKHQ